MSEIDRKLENYRQGIFTMTELMWHLLNLVPKVEIDQIIDVLDKDLQGEFEGYLMAAFRNDAVLFRLYPLTEATMSAIRDYVRKREQKNA